MYMCRPISSFHAYVKLMLWTFFGVRLLTVILVAELVL